ncbi:MAG TPA: superoxide dismutase [Stellaceae bacterium]|jgi:Fe-Mn family superoxide dismutase|nr:superoxide dismutase [Stellaceae bacterium]
MAFQLPPLPYPANALEPYVSAKTLDFHHGKHHKAYVDNLNRMVEGKPEANQSLEEIIAATHHDDAKTGVFNNAAQVWNHTFFWNCMAKGGGGEPGGEVKKAIEHDFGKIETFTKEFKEAATTQFGSGWAWLVFDAGKLKVIKTANAVNPIAGGQTALLTCDVWEHAYYLDYQNRRPDFVQAFIEHLINWDFVAKNLAKALERHG